MVVTHRTRGWAFPSLLLGAQGGLQQPLAKLGSGECGYNSPTLYSAQCGSLPILWGWVLAEAEELEMTLTAV